MLSLPDMLIIGGAALLVFGPKRLPEVAKAVGKGVRDFKKALEGHEEPARTVSENNNVELLAAEEKKKEKVG